MSTSYSYADLVAELKTYKESTGSKFVAEIPQLIANAESRVLRDLDLTIFDQTATNITFTAGSQNVTKPSGAMVILMLRYPVTATQYAQLRMRTLEYIDDYAPDSAVTGTPLFYAELNDTTLKVAPAVATTKTTGICRYVKRPDGLSSTVGSTWLGSNVGDLLLYAGLMASEEWDVNDERVAVWKSEYDARLTTAKHEFRSLIRKG